MLSVKIKNLLSSDAQSKPVATRGATQLVSKRIILTGVLLVLSIILSTLGFGLGSFLSKPNATYSRVVTEQKIIAQQIALDMVQLINGNTAVLNLIQVNRTRYQSTFDMLDAGDSALSIPPLPETYQLEYARLKTVWRDQEQNIQLLIEGQATPGEINRQIEQIKAALSELTGLTNTIMETLIATQAPAGQIAITARQLSLLMSIGADLTEIVTARLGTEDARDRLNSTSQEIETQFTEMLNGSQKKGIRKFTDQKVLPPLLQLADQFSMVHEQIHTVLLLATKLVDMRRAVQDFQAATPILLAASTNLTTEIAQQEAELEILFIAGLVFGALSLVLLVSLLWLIIYESRQRLLKSQDQNNKNQAAILQLLDEMSFLSEGDLSTHTTVTEEITGAIADSVNYSIDALRDLVGTVNKTATQVSGAVAKTQSTAGQLVEASKLQAHEINHASEIVTRISQSMLAVSAQATDSAEVARKSVTIAHEGGETVRETIAGMEVIRGQIQETSKRIKRLGESSQEIGDIVSLITEISDQTNILALNAAIQASMAGEAGRGFAVVADEVQRLAERTGDATKRIEALVKAIQTDTHEASVSMEQSITNVVRGAKFTENSGEALDRIEKVSLNLAKRILEISDATKTQAEENIKIMRAMDAIQTLTQRASKDSSDASGSIGELTQMVKAMQNSVAGFKLPSAAGKNQAVIIDDVTSHNLLN